VKAGHPTKTPNAGLGSPMAQDSMVPHRALVSELGGAEVLGYLEAVSDPDAPGRISAGRGQRIPTPERR
jgi:hypothetical protein